MRRTGLKTAAGGAALAAALALCGCQHHLVFTTATKFGIDISQREDRVPEVTFGYDRVELASIPTKEETDASEKRDAYSVLGTFCVDFGGDLRAGIPLTVRQRFATGMAAQNLADNKNALQALAAKHVGSRNEAAALTAPAKDKTTTPEPAAAVDATNGASLSADEAKAADGAKTPNEVARNGGARCL